MNPTKAKTIPTTLLTLSLSLFVLLFVEVTANAQTYTPEETSCYNMVQGKVAWDTAGSTSWSESNVRSLCKGTTNASATITCFRSKISAGLSWDKAIAACPATASTRATPATPSISSSPYTAEETSCYNNVQGKVAWDTAGSTTWSEANVRSLCKGTTNANATISCFRSKISSGLTWDKATSACAPAALSSQPRKNTAALLQEQSPEVEAISLYDSKITFRNYGANAANIRIFRSDRPNDPNPVGEGRSVPQGGVTVTDVSYGHSTNHLEVEVRMTVFGGYVSIYRGTIIPSGSTNFCFEANGTAYIPSVKPCDNTQATEGKRISFKNEAGFTAKMSLDYIAQDADSDSQSVKTITTDDTILGMTRAIYIPRDAVLNRQMTLKVNGIGTHNDALLSSTLDGRTVTDSTCYKVWGSQLVPKVSPCSVSAGGRTIKLMNRGAFNAKMEVAYYTGDALQRVTSNLIELLHDESVEIPASTSTRPIELKFYADGGTLKLFSTTTVSPSFTGELCYRTEGTIFGPTVSACDNSVGDASTSDVRQIRFQNDAAYDAQMTVNYFVYEKRNNTDYATMKTVDTGFINGLGGKYRLVNIPKSTVPGLPITISLTGQSTLKNDVYSTTLPADFSGAQPCFKVWGTLFNPSGGTCNQ